MNLPTKLTVLRIIMIPIFTAVYFLTVIPCNYLISAIIFALAAFTDFLDGKIARKYNLVTDLGKFLDPIADKVLVSTALIIMLVSSFSFSIILPWYASIGVAIILARELIVSGFRMVAASKNRVIAADKSGKIKTFVQDIAIFVLLVSADVLRISELAFDVVNIAGQVFFWVSVLLTIISGAECLIKNADVLKEEK
jgi:CDP-diacylglycerol--glycerol-3-phosphate 3-phosphatidyltransferase